MDAQSTEEFRIHAATRYNNHSAETKTPSNPTQSNEEESTKSPPPNQLDQNQKHFPPPPRCSCGKKNVAKKNRKTNNPSLLFEQAVLLVLGTVVRAHPRARSLARSHSQKSFLRLLIGRLSSGEPRLVVYALRLLIAIALNSPVLSTKHMYISLKRTT